MSGNTNRFSFPGVSKLLEEKIPKDVYKTVSKLDLIVDLF